MSIKVLERLREERDQARSIAIELASAEDFDAESSAFKEAEARAVDLDAQIARLVGLVEARQAADAVDGRLARASTRTTEQADNDTRSLGEQFVGSDVFRAWNGRGSSSRLEVRALPTGVGSIGSFAGHTKINLGFAPNVNAGVADLATVINVSNNAVDYIRWAPKAGDKALVVAEGTDKPLIEFVPTPTSVTLDTIAAATQFTRQLAQDEAALVSLLNTELQREVSRAIEAEAAKAVGAATLPTAAGPADGGLLAALRVGYGKVQAAGYSPNGFLVHPDDLAGLDIAVMQTAGTGPDRRAAYWGMTAVVDPNATAGTITVGDFASGLHRYSRMGVELFVTDSHADTFLKNVFTALAEARQKTVVVRPAALVEVTVAEAP